MKKKLIEYLIFLVIALGAAPVGAAVWQWSLTPGTNASIDTTINWAEGMAPSSINDSARAMMARLAEWRQDISGANVLTGTSTAYVLATTAATNSGTGLCANSASLTDGQMIAFRANVTNGVSALITVDNCAQLPLQSTAGTALPAGSIIGGTPYRASYNLASNAWVMEAIYGNPYNTPLGAILWSTLSSPPNSNFVTPSGQCISNTTYNTYYVGLGSPAQGSCSSGQFPIVDMRGRVATALDNLGGTPANRLTTASGGCGVAFTTMGITCTNAAESRSIVRSDLPNTSATVNISDPGHSHSYSQAIAESIAAPQSGFSTVTVTTGTTGVSTTGITASLNLNGNVTQTATPMLAPNVGLYAYLRVL